VESRRAGRFRLNAEHASARRTVLMAMAKCFFSFLDIYRFAFQCRSLVKCFSCEETGHRSFDCPRKRNRVEAQAQLFVSTIKASV
jgi:hypothetical protein